jgi:hypothetical protein
VNQDCCIVSTFSNGWMDSRTLKTATPTGAVASA